IEGVEKSGNRNSVSSFVQLLIAIANKKINIGIFFINPYLFSSVTASFSPFVCKYYFHDFTLRNLKKPYNQ
ncbi:MAG: hypothetical protein PHC55_12590, partial [Bacteroidales bacterium]|nr:hypothetical protein [Bacteroidales bacterium]